MSRGLHGRGGPRHQEHRHRRPRVCRAEAARDAGGCEAGRRHHPHPGQGRRVQAPQRRGHQGRHRGAAARQV